MIRSLAIAVAITAASLTPGVALAEQQGQDVVIYPLPAPPTPEDAAPALPAPPTPEEASLPLPVTPASETPPADATLPRTGSDGTSMFLQMGSLLLVAGGGVVIATHRRRSTPAAS